jgi:hypothetical protein
MESAGGFWILAAGAKVGSTEGCQCSLDEEAISALFIIKTHKDSCGLLNSAYESDLC